MGKDIQNKATKKQMSQTNTNSKGEDSIKLLMSMKIAGMRREGRPESRWFRELKGRINRSNTIKSKICIRVQFFHLAELLIYNFFVNF